MIDSGDKMEAAKNPRILDTTEDTLHRAHCALWVLEKMYSSIDNT